LLQAGLAKLTFDSIVATQPAAVPSVIAKQNTVSTGRLIRRGYFIIYVVQSFSKARTASISGKLDDLFADVLTLQHTDKGGRRIFNPISNGFFVNQSTIDNEIFDLRPRFRPKFFVRR
jgi:hypothetical protein